MFSNCYKYNPPDHEVVAMARKLQVRTCYCYIFKKDARQKVDLCRVLLALFASLYRAPLQKKKKQIKNNTAINHQVSHAAVEQGAEVINMLVSCPTNVCVCKTPILIVCLLLFICRMSLKCALPRCQMNQRASL